MRQAQQLQLEGFQIKLRVRDEEILLKFARICVIAGSVLRPRLDNRLQYKACCACGYCYHYVQVCVE